MLAPRQVIDRYELVCPLGNGGMAHVWAARQRGAHGFEKLVAIEIIHSRFAEDATFRRIFLEEARIASSIQHPNVAQVLDLGESGSLLYLVLEYVDGESLFDLLAPSRTAPIPIALKIAADACAGLTAAHTLVDPLGQPRNVVHRDVSPENLLLASSGEVKVIDFGLAHARDRTVATTGAGMVNGKVRYMAPEQARHEPLGPYTDVFGIGCTLARMIAGRAPYAAANDAETLQALVDLAPPLQPLPPEVPSAVVDVIHRAIAPRVGDRYATTRELGNALTGLLAREARPDVAGWVSANLGEKTLERRRSLGQAAPRQAPVPRRAPEPAAPAEAKDPGFMDVNALVARAGARSAQPEARPAPHAPPPPDDARAPPTEQAVPQSPVATKSTKPANDRSSRALKLGVFAIGLVILALGALLVLPIIVRDRVIATAREVGLDLKIDGVGVGFDGVTLRDVTVSAVRMPGIAATIREVHLASFSLKNARVLGLEARLDGDRDALDLGLAALLTDSRARLAGTTAAPHHLSVVGARVFWNGPGGERLSAGDVGLELDSRGPGLEELRGSVGRFELKTSSTTFGPWSAAFERSGTTSRARLMFDPPIPDGPSALVVWHKRAPTELTVKVARSSFKNLGVKPSEIGIPADDGTDVQLSVSGTLSATSEITFDVGLWALKPKGLSGPVDVHAEGAAKSSGGKPFELEKTTVSLGPFAAFVTGTVTPHDDALRVDAMFKTTPLPCERLARAEAKSMGPLAATLQAFGQSTGAFKITGAVNASGIVKYDTAEPQAASVTWLAKETCGVSIFGM